jgi:hypothetical protein
VALRLIYAAASAEAASAALDAFDAGPWGQKFPTTVPADHPKIPAAKSHHVAAGLEFGHANLFSGQSLADEYRGVMPVNLARRLNTSHLMVRVIPGQRQLIG